MNDSTLWQWITALGLAGILLEMVKRFFTFLDRRAEKNKSQITESATIVVKQMDDEAQFRAELREEVKTLRGEVKELQGRVNGFVEENAGLKAENRILKENQKSENERHNREIEEVRGQLKNTREELRNAQLEIEKLKQNAN